MLLILRSLKLVTKNRKLVRLQAREAASECVMFLPGCPFFCRTFSLTNFVHPTSSSKNYRIHCALLATAIPHVADITSIREVAGEQAFCGFCWPSMASGCRETSLAVGQVKRSPLAGNQLITLPSCFNCTPKRLLTNLFAQRHYADDKKPAADAARPAAIPASETNTSPVNRAALSARDYRFRSYLFSRAGSLTLLLLLLLLLLLPPQLLALRLLLPALRHPSREKVSSGGCATTC